MDAILLKKREVKDKIEGYNAGEREVKEKGIHFKEY